MHALALMPAVENIVLAGCGLAAALLMLTQSGAFAAEPAASPTPRLDAVVRLHTEIPAEARTATFLGTRRDGSGVLIDDGGLIVTIGYLVTEAMAAEVTTSSGKT